MGLAIKHPGDFRGGEPGRDPAQQAEKTIAFFVHGNRGIGLAVLRRAGTDPARGMDAEVAKEDHVMPRLGRHTPRPGLNRSSLRPELAGLGKATFARLQAAKTALEITARSCGATVRRRSVFPLHAQSAEPLARLVNLSVHSTSAFENVANHEAPL